MGKQISFFSKILLAIASALLVGSIFVPIWRIELDAPQYPEGLKLLIHADGLGGDVDIINGLNHYIGMKTMHNEDFIEFAILPYLIAAFALFCIITVLFNRRIWITILLVAFVLFGILAMVDFWKWEYDYGHNLDPNAAIIVPGMAYQPPLIGFKQLLNFGAYSIPDIGGWLFITSGLMMLIAFFREHNFFRKTKIQATKVLVIIIGSTLGLTSCQPKGPEPIIYNKDNCAHCKMTIADPRFGAELLTLKGRIYKFDELSCMLNYIKENATAKDAKLFVSNFEKPYELSQVEKLIFIEGPQLDSPMGGNIAGLMSEEIANEIAVKVSGRKISWDEITTK